MKWAHYLYIFRVTAALLAIKLQRLFAMQHYDTSKAPNHENDNKRCDAI